MRLPIFNRLKACFSAFNADRSGIAVVYVAVALPVIIGFSLLAIDFGRLATLQSSLQHGADALALAGAGELDRSPTAIDRANLAITNLVTSNNELFPTTAATVSSGNVTKCYLAALPPSDATVIPSVSFPCMPVATPADRTSSSSAARFVQVVVNPTNFTTIFPATFIGAAANTSNSTAQAVAGFDAAVCKFTPMFMCNPLETSQNQSTVADDHGLFAMANDYTTRRKVIKFLAFTGGGTTPAVPGQYGFLDVKGAAGTNGGASALGKEIASTSPPECYLLNTINPKTGQMNELEKAFNTRFDMYAGNFKANAYPPGLNVRKGFPTTYTASAKGKSGNVTITSSPTACSTQPAAIGGNNPATVMAFPVDNCFSGAGTCGNNGGNANIGKGDSTSWGYDPDSGNVNVNFRTSGSVMGYWDLNFGGVAAPTAECGGALCSNSNLPSRYDIYRYEIANNLYKDYSNTGGSTSPPTPAANTSTNTETGIAQCAASTAGGLPPVDTSTGGVDRRILYAAIMNCKANNLQPGSNGTYHALAFGKFFMIRPINPANDILWTELVGIVAPGDGTGVAQDRVQLYR